MDKYRLRFGECEHTGDLDHYVDDCRAAGAHVESAEVNECAEVGTVVISIETDFATFRAALDEDTDAFLDGAVRLES